GGDVGVGRGFDAGDGGGEDGGGVFVGVEDNFNGFGSGGWEGMEGNDVVWVDVGEDGGDGDEVGGEEDVDFVGLEEIEVGGGVEDGDEG
ncbi:hypothetical protein, partial [Neisseria sicca]|uniref:hypothetical protein n=1 Tax=Neisseria sicca TaxID=490 RepID=UPI001C9978D4